MKTTHRTIKYGVMAIIIGLALSQTRVMSQVTVRTLEGVWFVQTTPRNCTTGDPIPAAAFAGIYTFNSDGTMISGYSTGTPTTGQGLWRREEGWSDYSFRLGRFLRSTTGMPSGRQEIGGSIKLNEIGDEYTSDEYAIVYSADGVPGTPACINSLGTRFKLEP